jgi:NADH:ubiquinone reductase (H+-translocating)
MHGVDYLTLAHWHCFRFRQGEVVGLDRARRELKLSAVKFENGDEILPPRTLPYDTLVLCVGSVNNDFGVRGVAEHAIALDTAVDAERFHRLLLGVCVRADSRAAHGGSPAVDIVIIGGGATGVELAAEIRQTTRAHAGYGLDHLDTANDIRLTLLEAAPRILPQLSDKIALAATELLERLHIDVRADEPVAEVTSDGVRTGTGRFFRADLVVWAAGIKAPAWLAHLDGLEVNRNNQLVVTPTLQTTRDPDIFAFGDCAACPRIEPEHQGKWVPPRAQSAHQQATMLVKSIRARIDGKALPQFRFRDHGSLVSLGELSAVGNLMGRLIGGNMVIQGLIARIMYASLYKLHQISIYGYLRVAFDTMGRFLRRRLEPRVKLH